MGRGTCSASNAPHAQSRPCKRAASSWPRPLSTTVTTQRSGSKRGARRVAHDDSTAAYRAARRCATACSDAGARSETPLRYGSSAQRAMRQSIERGTGIQPESQPPALSCPAKPNEPTSVDSAVHSEVRYLQRGGRDTGTERDASSSHGTPLTLCLNDAEKCAGAAVSRPCCCPAVSIDRSQASQAIVCGLRLRGCRLFCSRLRRAQSLGASNPPAERRKPVPPRSDRLQERGARSENEKGRRHDAAVNKQTRLAEQRSGRSEGRSVTDYRRRGPHTRPDARIGLSRAPPSLRRSCHSYTSAKR